MPALFIFLLKVNAALLLFCAGYYLALRRLTFYTLNRVYLVTAILFASVYPEINLSDFAQHNRELTKPVQMVIVNWQAPAEKLIKPAAEKNYWQWIEVTFWAGVVLLSIKLLVQLFSLFRLYRNSATGQIYGHKVRIIKGNAGPFSFWKSIFVNPANHQQADLKAILLHEQVHVNGWHTLDILLAELSTIFYWFNPGIWLMKKAIRENIEFITDRKILNKGADSKQYQYSLVSVSFSSNSDNLVNHFNLSTIKKRIIMMNAKRSSKLNLTRYAFLVPAVIVLLLVFSISNAAFVKKNKTKQPRRVTVKTKKTNTIVSVKAQLSLTNIIKEKIQKTKVQADTNHVSEPTRSLSLTPGIKITDTITKKDTKSVLPSMYIVDGLIVKTYDIRKVDANEILSIDVGKSANGKAVVYVTTKNGVQVTPITKIRLDGKDTKLFKGKVIDGHIAIMDTVTNGNTAKLSNGHVVLDTVIVGKPL
jgi:hypothetical protein